MLDDEGNIKTIEFKPKHIVEEDELHYVDLPSVHSVDAYIDSLLASSHENNCSHEQTICHRGTGIDSQMMVNDIDNFIITGKISMAIGSTIENNNPCSLFTNSSSELEDRFNS